MDQDTRNKLQRATQQVRRILEEEFAAQLEGVFDILADGTILPEPGKHLDARQRLNRHKLVDAIEHIKAGGKKSQEAVDEYTREAAFTFLNRFVALRMLEARGMLQECVSKGDQSSGFKEFCGLAPGLAALPDGGYRLYLECLCDELSVEVKVLFDRRDSASLLWLRRGALTELLDILGQADLASVWSEDETIGWVYQYFNSGEERKEMREESQAPRNSRELAVRNQFFTPRYVVEFLTDNTLGRIWYEMREGQTRLVDECRYLIRRPNELFLNEGQTPPEDDAEAEPDLSQEELLNKTVFIPHRAKKDPRDIKILDPACGSGHFLLYAFDLLIAIYEEAWHDETSPPAFDVIGPDYVSPAKRLREDYPELLQLHAALPGLVLAHNLHGIDIDPRAAQIAALALWMRGQREFNDFQIAREQRPAIARSNIVCAEPMPGEAAFLDEFIATHLANNAEGQFLASLVRRVFEAMKLAGEAGSLLKIEEDIADEVAKAKKQWLERPEFKQKLLFATDPENVQQELDLAPDITDASFWEEADQRIYDALHTYSEQAERTDGFQQRLFAADAARGFATIDLLRHRYDVVLMNPPFGEFIDEHFSFLDTHYKTSKRDLAIVFIDRALELTSGPGTVGVLHSRKPFFLDTQAPWRRHLISIGHLSPTADLGHRVLDDALVEVAGTVIQKGDGESTFIQCLDTPAKDHALADVAECKSISDRVTTWNLKDFSILPSNQFAYDVPRDLLRVFRERSPLDPNAAFCRDGLSTRDNFRFLRLYWEVPHDALENGWVRLSKGGEYQSYYLDCELVALWEEGKGQMYSYGDSLGNGAVTKKGSTHYFKPSLTYTERTASRFAARILPGDTVFSTAGPGIILLDSDNLCAVLGILNSYIFSAVYEVCLGGGDSVSSGSAARHYTAGGIGRMPFPAVEHLQSVGHWPTEQLVNNALESARERETSPVFSLNFSVFEAAHTVEDAALKRLFADEQRYLSAWDLSRELEEASLCAYGLQLSTLAGISNVVGPHPAYYPAEAEVDEKEFTRLYSLSDDALVDEIAPILGNPRYAVIKSYVANRKYELISHRFQVHPKKAVELRRRLAILPSDATKNEAKRLLGLLVGMSLGRWQYHQRANVSLQDLIQHGLPRSTFSTSLDAEHALLVDDEGHSEDMLQRIDRTIQEKLNGELVADALLQLAGPNGSLREFLSKSFFQQHISDYSLHRRAAPIYWQLATPSASYSAWVYYHRLTKDTFFKVLNEYVKPKHDHERQRLDRLRGEAGAEPTRSQRKEIENQEKFVAELASMVEEVERIAPLWNPNLNDGVIINFAPLWRLVPQNKSWQKECKKVWDKLVAGDYDWAHLAMHLWPERVVPKCVTDASLAIAHGLEETFWTQDDRDRFQPLEEPTGGWQPIFDNLVAERTSPAVKAALESLLNAPAPAAAARRRGSNR